MPPHCGPEQRRVGCVAVARAKCVRALVEDVKVDPGEGEALPLERLDELGRQLRLDLYRSIHWYEPSFQITPRYFASCGSASTHSSHEPHGRSAETLSSAWPSSEPSGGHE